MTDSTPTLTYTPEYLDYARATLSPAMVTLAQRAFQVLERYRASHRGPIDKAYMNAFTVNQLASGISANYAFFIRSRLASYFRWCVDTGRLDVSPVGAFKFNKPAPTNAREAITQEEYELLKIAAEERAKSKTFWFIKGMVIVGWNTGLRLGDVAGLRWTSIDFDRSTIKVQTRKTNRTVEIPMNSELRECLAEFFANRKDSSNFVWLAAASMYQQRHSMLGGAFSKLCEGIGSPGKSFHCFRHAFVTRCLNAGIQPHVVSSLTGHSIAMLDRYSHASLDDKRRELQKLA